MDAFAPYLAQIKSEPQRARMAEVLSRLRTRFPALVPVIKWNQPMFTDHGTFIIGFSVAKPHIAVAPEQAAMARFAGDIAAAGYTATRELFRIQWAQPVDYDLLERIIAFNMLDKADCHTFWRK